MRNRRRWVFGAALVTAAVAFGGAVEASPWVVESPPTPRPFPEAPALAASMAVPVAEPRPAPSPPVEAASASPSSRCDPPEQLDVLFIGNSYLLMHRIPDLVAELGQQVGIELHTELLAMGGTNFEYHLARQKTADALAKRDWDVVVLQSHSLDTIRNREGFLAAGEALTAMVREAGAEPLLFETWARKADSKIYRFSRAGENPQQMQALVHEGYAQLSERTGAEVVDVGAAWRASRTAAPNLDLYASDSNHPGKAGSFLSAMVVFSALTDLSPVGRVQPLLGVAPEDSRILQQHAAAIVQPRCGGV